MKLRPAPLLILPQLGRFTCIAAQQRNAEHWVAAWTTAEMLARTPAPQPAAAQPAAAQPVAARGFNHQTVRMIARTSIGGRRLRVILSNAFGSEALAVGAAHIAIRAKESEIVGGSDRALSFNGKPGCTDRKSPR